MEKFHKFLLQNDLLNITWFTIWFQQVNRVSGDAQNAGKKDNLDVKEF